MTGSIASGSPSASCTTTATCPCCRCWSTSSSTTRRARTVALGTSGRTRRRRALRPAHRAPLRRRGGQAGRGRHVHPHQLRHTLATQSINRGMSLEAIAALLGHRSMDMTLTYARISDRTVAEAYFKVTEAVEAEYYGLSSAPLRTGGSGTRSRRPTTVVCSPTVTARGPPCSTAPSRASANGAGSSRPVRSSSPS
jgi:hypothetical protein